MSINPDVEINGGDLMGVACTVTSAATVLNACEDFWKYPFSKMLEHLLQESEQLYAGRPFPLSTGDDAVVMTRFRLDVLEQDPLEVLQKPMKIEDLLVDNGIKNPTQARVREFQELITTCVDTYVVDNNDAAGALREFKAKIELWTHPSPQPRGRGRPKKKKEVRQRHRRRLQRRLRRRRHRRRRLRRLQRRLRLRRRLWQRQRLRLSAEQGRALMLKATMCTPEQTRCLSRRCPMVSLRPTRVKPKQHKAKGGKKIYCLNG